MNSNVPLLWPNFFSIRSEASLELATDAFVHLKNGCILPLMIFDTLFVLEPLNSAPMELAVHALLLA